MPFYRILIEECRCNANIYDTIGDIKKKPICVAIEGGHISIIKLLLQHGVSPVGEVYSHDKQKPIHIAITHKQRQALQILLEHGANPDDKTSSGSAPAQLAVENDASTLLSLLISYGISFTKRDCYGNTLLHVIASSGAVRCAEYFLQYLSENFSDQIHKLLLEEKDERGRTPVDRAVDEGNESVLIEFFQMIDPNYFIEHPSLYHKLIEKNLFEALHALMDMSVYEKYLDVTLIPKFLDSISSVEHPYPDDPLYDRLEPSFIHKLLDCPDPLVKYHPLVSIVVREKLRFYRWWCVFTFFLYIFFLINLYYALIEASFLRDDVLLSYDTPSSRVRAFFETVVVISWIILRISMKLSFLSHWSRLHRRLLIIDSENDKFSDPTWRSRLNRFFSHLFPALMTGVKINPTLILAELSMVILVILRITQSPVQWIFASLTIVLYTLHLINYVRVSTTLAQYTDCISQLFKSEILKFSIMIIIFFVTYKTGIRLASINTFSNRSYSEINKTPSGILYLLNGELRASDLLDVNILFTIAFLIFALIFIALLICVLIAQFVTTYKSLIKRNKSHFEIDLVIDIELRSSIATFFGRKLRNWTSITELTISHSIWNVYQDRRSKLNREVPFVLKKHTQESKRNYKQLQFENELVKEEIVEMKLNQERSLILNLALERKLASLEDKLDQLLKK